MNTTKWKQFWRRARWPLLITAGVISLAILLSSLIQIFLIDNMYRDAENEYAALQQRIGPAAMAPGADYAEADAGVKTAEQAKAINPDYVGWISINGTKVDYPVVRGLDNVKYLDTTFEGTNSSAGAIFMDYRNTASFGSYNTVLYGHNVRRGGMFGELYKYEDPAFLSENPTVTVTTDGGTLTYAIFKVQRTDAWDPTYQMAFSTEKEFEGFSEYIGAPEGTSRILTLSTCTNTGNDDERLLVHAALIA